MATTVFHENTFTINGDVTQAGTVTVEKDAFLFGMLGDNALDISFVKVQAKIDGFLFNTTGHGLVFYDTTAPSGNSTLNVGTEGVILSTAAGFDGINSSQGVDITNAGLIQGNDAGIDFHDMLHSTSKSIAINNAATGQISGNNFGIRIVGGQHSLFLTNKGEIEGSVSNDGDASKITNTGKIGGFVSLGDGINIVTNSGKVNGYIQVGDGNDMVSNGIGGDIGTALTLGQGNNTVSNGGSIGSTLTAGDGNDVVTNSGIIGGSLDLAGGNDTLTNSGKIAGFAELDGGNNKVTNTGRIEGYLTMGAGNDVVSSTKYIQDQLDLGAGNNTLISAGSIGNGIATFSILGGDGNDTVTNSATLSAGINLGHGINKLTNADWSVAAWVSEPMTTLSPTPSPGRSQAWSTSAPATTPSPTPGRWATRSFACPATTR